MAHHTDFEIVDHDFLGNATEKLEGMAVAGEELLHGLGERERLQTLLLLPLRDIVGVVSLILGLTQKTVVRRNKEFLLTKDGRVVPMEVRLCESSSSTETTSALLSR